MKDLPSPVGLVTFNVVATRLNFSRAGRDLHITQAAVSHRIRALEEELGLALFTRTSRRVRLTPAGVVLFRATREAFLTLQQGVAQMHAIGSPGRVTVSCSPSFAIRWLMPRLGALREAVPGIELHIAAQDELVEPSAGSIDLCVRYGPGGYPRVAVERLTMESATPVCAPHYLERMRLKEPNDLQRCVLLHDDVLAHHPLHVGWKEWLTAAKTGGAWASAGLRFSHSHLALDAAVAGQGVALARGSLVQQDLDEGRLVAPFELRVDSGLTYWLVSPRKQSTAPTVAAFQDWLRTATRDDA